MLPTIFEKPQAQLSLDPYGARRYANVDNRMEVTQRDRPAFHVPIAVPTELFTLFAQHLDIARDDPVSLSLDEVEDDNFVFSVLYANETKLADLWSIPRKMLPGFVLNSKYRV